jgi:Asp-tRNA(Asn)/Glu-tRNA(Gln) amidotransferase C subunit
VDIPIDTMRPNEAVLEKCKDIVSLISDTLELDCGGILPNQNNIQNSLRSDDECSE